MRFAPSSAKLPYPAGDFRDVWSGLSAVDEMMWGACMWRFASVGAAFLSFVSPASAADMGFSGVAKDAAPLVSEARLGAFIHDPFSVEKGSADINGELLFAPFGRDLQSAWGWLTPRVHVGGTVNLGGATSTAYMGFTWTKDITAKWFVEGALGGAVHSGSTADPPEPGRSAMGCRFAFHEAASIGYRLGSGWSLMGTVEHYSNAGLCDRNRGLTNMGVRVGYTF